MFDFDGTVQIVKNNDRVSITWEGTPLLELNSEQALTLAAVIAQTADSTHFPEVTIAGQSRDITRDIERRHLARIIATAYDSSTVETIVEPLCDVDFEIADIVLDAGYHLTPNGDTK